VAMTSENITYLITAILLILVVIKTYLFFSGSNNKRSLENWFFFSNYALYNSRNDKSKKSKLLQNRLTWFVIVLAVIDIVVFILSRNTF